MNEELIEAIYNEYEELNSTGSLDDFKSFLSTPEGRQGFYDNFEPIKKVGSFEEFNSAIGAQQGQAAQDNVQSPDISNQKIKTMLPEPKAAKSNFLNKAVNAITSTNVGQALWRPVEATIDAIERGLASGKAAGYLVDDNLDSIIDIQNGDFNITDEAAVNLAKLQQDIKANPVSEETQRFIRSNSVGEALSNLADAPVQILGEVIGESMASLVRGGIAPLLTGMGISAAAPVAAPVAMATAFGLASMKQEMASTIIERLEENGYDVTNPVQIKEAFEDENFIDDVVRVARTKGMTVGAIEAATMGVASKIGASRTVSSALRSRRKAQALALGVESAGGVGTEYFGAKSIGEETTAGAMVAEAVASVATDAPAVLAISKAKINRDNSNELAELVDKGEGEAFKAQVDYMTTMKDITPEQGQVLKSNFETLEAENERLKPIIKDRPRRKAIVGLIGQKKALAEAIDKKTKDLNEIDDNFKEDVQKDLDNLESQKKEVDAEIKRTKDGKDELAQSESVAEQTGEAPLQTEVQEDISVDIPIPEAETVNETTNVSQDQSQVNPDQGNIEPNIDVNQSEQVAPEPTPTVKEFETELESSYDATVDLSEDTLGNINLSKVVIPKEQRKQGIGTDLMNDLTSYADQTGKTITLTPSKDFGATSVGRLKKFYKRFGFVENKGRNANPEISDSMYRLPEPVEAAQTVSEPLSTENQPNIPVEQQTTPDETIPDFNIEPLPDLDTQGNLKRVEGELSKAALKIQDTIGSPEIGNQLAESKSGFVQALDNLEGDNSKKLARILGDAIINNPRVPKILQDALGKDYVDGIRKLAKQRAELGRLRSEELRADTLEARAQLDNSQLTNEKINELRESIDQEILTSHPETVDQWIQDAFANNVSKDGSLLKETRIAIKAIEGGALTPSEQVALANTINNLNVTLAAHKDALARAKAIGTHEVGKIKSQMQFIENELDSFTRAMFMAGSTLGRSFRVRQEFWNNNRFTAASLRARAQDQMSSGKLSKNDKEFFGKRADEYAKLDEQLKKWIQRRNAKGKDAVDAVAESNLNTLVKNKKKTKTSLDKALQNLDNILDKPC